MTKFSRTLALYVSLITAPALADGVLSIKMQDSRLASSRALEYTGTCQSNTFALRIAHDSKALDLTLREQTKVDLKASSLGKALFFRPLAGEFVFRCLGDNLEIRFYGFLIDEKSAPKPVSYFLLMDFAGKTVRDDGLVTDESLEAVAHYFNYRVKR